MDDIKSRLGECNQREAARIIRLLGRSKGKPGPKDLKKIQDWFEKGRARVDQRKSEHRPVS